MKNKQTNKKTHGHEPYLKSSIPRKRYFFFIFLWAGRVSITVLTMWRTPRQQPKEDRHSRETAGIQVFSSSVVPQGLLGVRHLVDSERPAVCSLLDLKTSLGAERMLVADSSMGSSEKVSRVSGSPCLGSSAAAVSLGTRCPSLGVVLGAEGGGGHLWWGGRSCPGGARGQVAAGVTLTQLTVTSNFSVSRWQIMGFFSAFKIVS